MSHLAFVDNDTFDISKISYEKCNGKSRIECYKIMIDDKPMIYQTPPLFTFRGAIVSTDKFFTYRSIMFSNVDENSETFFSNIMKMEEHMKTMETTTPHDFEDFESKLKSIKHRYVGEKYGFRKVYEKVLTGFIPSFREDRHCSIKCEMIENNISKDMTITDDNICEQLPSNSFIKCDMSPVVYYNHKYYGISWKICGVSILSVNPELKKI